MLRRPLLLCALLVVLMPAAAAHAGTYDVYSCYAGTDSFRNPAANASAWNKVGDPGDRYRAFDQCGSTESGFGVISVSGFQAPKGAGGDVFVTAPSGTRIQRVQFWRTAWTYGSGNGSASQRSSLIVYTDGQTLSNADNFDGSADVPVGAAGTSDTANHGLIPANLMDVDLSSRLPAAVSYKIACPSDSGCPTASPDDGFAAGVKIYGTILTLRDTSDPSLSVANGGLLSDGEHHGRETVHVQSAGDNSGIKRLAVFEENATSPVGVVDFERNADKCAWWSVSPCQNVTDVDVSVDTRRVSDGPHRFVVRAYDAAENVRGYTTAPVTIKNGADAKPDSLGTAVPVVRGALNGAGASDRAVLRAWFTRGRRSSLQTGFARSVGVAGVLLDEAGKPIAGAEVGVSGAAAVAHTDLSGRFGVTLPARGASRRIVVTYRSHLGDPSPVATRELRLSVTAGVRLSVSPRHVRNGRTIRFTGALLGRPLPSRGKLVDMQVLVGRRWQTFATTRAHGRRATFGYRYRFTRTTTRITYRFRALARAEAAYPYATGASPTVRVRVN